MNTEILELFWRYRDLLSGEIQSETAVEWMTLQCSRIVRRLHRRGYEILSKTNSSFEDPAVILWFKLYLVQPSSDNQLPLATSIAIMRQLPPKQIEGDSFETILARTEAEQSEAANASSSVWRRDWRFEESEAHAFLAAFERHWESLEQESRLERGSSRGEMILPKRETIFTIIRGSGTLAPAGPCDIFIFSFLLDRELEYLITLASDSELPECGCDVEEHLCSLENWEMRNLL